MFLGKFLKDDKLSLSGQKVPRGEGDAKQYSDETAYNEKWGEPYGDVLSAHNKPRLQADSKA